MLGVLSFTLSIAAVETILALNNITNVSLTTSLGQVMSLTAGMSSLAVVLWNLRQQELVSLYSRIFRRDPVFIRRSYRKDNFAVSFIGPSRLSTVTILSYKE